MGMFIPISLIPFHFEDSSLHQALLSGTSRSNSFGPTNKFWPQEQDIFTKESFKDALEDLSDKQI